MFFKDYYHGHSKKEIQQDIIDDGFSPQLITNPPGYKYSEHQHKETKILGLLEGSMEITVNSETFTCFAGDKLVIQGNTPHAAVVGKDGCTFFWAEKVA